MLPKACNAALRAGAAILEIYKNEEEYDIDLKSDMTPITLADRNAHDVIKRYLATTLIPVLSEEGREMLFAERKGWDLFWMVDPLDGTKEFIKGNGEFTVNIALMENNRPVLSVVYVPYISRLYFADKPLGAFRKDGVKANHESEAGVVELMENAHRLPLTTEMNNPVRIATSRSNGSTETDEYIARIKSKYPDAEIVIQGSSYKLCLVAEGSIEYYPRTSDTCEWDTAAGELIIDMAGGRLSDLNGERLEYNKESLINPWFECMSSHLTKIYMEQNRPHPIYTIDQLSTTAEDI